MSRRTGGLFTIVQTEHSITLTKPVYLHTRRMQSAHAAGARITLLTPRAQTEHFNGLLLSPPSPPSTANYSNFSLASMKLKVPNTKN